MSKYIIIGCGGIGAAVAKACLSSGDEVVVLNRSVKNDLPFNVESIDNLDSILDKYVPDFVIVATGMLFGDESSPEKSLPEFSLDWLSENINSNLMPSVNAAKVLSKHMTRSSPRSLLGATRSAASREAIRPARGMQPYARSRRAPRPRRRRDPRRRRLVPRSSLPR